MTGSIEYSGHTNLAAQSCTGFYTFTDNNPMHGDNFELRYLKNYLFSITPRTKPNGNAISESI